MKNIVYMIMIIVISSCFNDIGNYDYIEIEDISIEGVPEDLGDLILFEDTIRIEPMIEPNSEVEANNFNYYWSKKMGTGTTAKMVRFSEEKNLILPVHESGDIFLMLEVEHKETGIIKFTTVKAKGTSKMSNGYYLLKENADGTTDVDMIGFDSESGEATTYANLLESVLGSGLEGAPVAIDYWGYRYEDYETATLIPVPALRIASNKDIAVINTDKFELLGQFDDLFLGDVPTIKNIQALKSINRITMLINDGQVYCYTNYYSQIVESELTEYGGNRFLPALIGDYNMSPHISWAVQDNGHRFLTYDLTSGNFKCIYSSASTPSDIKEYVGVSDFVDDLKSDLLFMESTASGAYRYNIYALMQKREHPDSLMLLDLNAQGLNDGYVKQNNKDILMANEYLIDDASNWCVHQHLAVIYFSINDKLYMYNPANQTEKLIASFNGEEITHIDVVNEWYTVTDGYLYKMDNVKMIVATQSGGEYTFRKYHMSSDLPDAEPYFTAKGSGIIKDYAYLKPNACPVWMRTYN